MPHNMQRPFPNRKSNFDKPRGRGFWISPWNDRPPPYTAEVRTRLFLAIAAAWLAVVPSLGATPGRILKVLPHRMDREGRVALSPSLYERDAYQAELRGKPELCGGLRFDVQWRAQQVGTNALRLRIELLTSTSSRTQPVVIESPVKATTGRSRWSKIELRDEAYRQAGKVIAWRATLWAGDTQLAERKSFLW